MRDSVPRTYISGSINGAPFVLQAPKDAQITNLSLLATNLVTTSNGPQQSILQLTVGSISTAMNPDVIQRTGEAQAAQIQASGVIVANVVEKAVQAFVASLDPKSAVSLLMSLSNTNSVEAKTLSSSVTNTLATLSATK